MADPFEVRMRFTTLLTHLSASTTSSIKTAHYALKHRDMDEDLHSCIIENLERGVSSNTATSSTATTGSTTGTVQGNSTTASSTTAAASATANAASMNNRANIMYFLEHFCEMALRENHQPYVDFVRRDIGKIVDCVAASGANVKVVRKVVGELGVKGVLDDTIVRKIEEDLKAKEKERGALLGYNNADGDDDEGDPPVIIGGDGGGGIGDQTQTSTRDAGTETSRDGAEAGKRRTAEGNRSVPKSGREGKTNGVSKADKRAIEQRIEEDRERNKRLREGVWAINGDDEQELEKMWNEGSDLSEDDYIIAGEEAEERKQFARYHRTLLEK